jgi:hypothetical protein
MIFRVWAGLGALLLFAALPAGAQMIRTSGGPMAQTGSPADGITVNGFGSLDVPASKAVITVHISSQTPFTVAQIKPLIDDVAKADGSSDSATIPPFIMPANAPLRTFTATGTVNAPTAKMLTDAIPLLAAAVAKAPPGIQLDNAQVTLSLADCESYVDKARAEAVRDARRRAESLAHDFGGKVGAVIAIAATDQLLSSSGVCTKQYFFSGGFGQSEPMNIDDYVTVRVAERVAVRYAILK